MTSGSEDIRDEGEGEDGGEAHEPFETLRQAAKAVAAAAAVGAAVGAARAFTTRDSGEEDEEREHADAQAQLQAQEEEDQEEDEGERPAAASAPRDEDQLDEEPELDEKDSEPERAPTAERQEPAQVERRENGADENGSVEDGAKPVHGESLEETTAVVRRAREALHALQGREPESISSLERTDGGWTATFELLELERVPNSMDVMASYEVVLDDQKNMVRYSKARRYYRGHADREGGA
jgi:hypothetical protein